MYQKLIKLVKKVIKIGLKMIKLKLKEPHNGKIGFKGKLIEVKAKEITIKSKNVQLIFAYDNIKGANLVLTDEEFRQLLKGIK